MQTSTHISIIDWALNYAADPKHPDPKHQGFGWAVFPLHTIDAKGNCTCGDTGCKSPGKHPKTTKGSLDASKDEAQITSWFAGGGSNIGIATGKISELVVVDLDTAKGADFNDLLIGGLDQTIFTTPKVKTGGGLHYYYKLPPGVSIKNSASKLGKFIDVRGDGGYVVAPPSIHANGHQYVFRNQVDTLLEFPKEWLDKVNAPATQLPHTGFVVPPAGSTVIMPEQINQGQRNVEMSRIAGSLRSRGLSEAAIYAALAVENQRICQPPLDDKELHQIAHSIGRYQPNETISAVADNPDDPNAQPDYENTLTPYLFGEFLDATFEEKEILSFHIGKRDIAILQAATNAGKTTLLRNAGLCMSAGRPFMPFFEGKRPVKVAYFDFENDAQDVQRDLREMVKVFTPNEIKALRDNLIIIPKGLMGGELFQFNRHEGWANALILQNNVEFIIVDNVSAAYDINDENSNAEVTKKVIKPLLKMAYKGDCAFLFAHHYGKAKNELEHAGVHAGRGASALQSLSRTVINMFGDVSKGEPVTVECAKRKTDGGQNYRETFRLEDDRWFHHTVIVAPPKRQTTYVAVRQFIEKVDFPETVSTKEIISEFESLYGPDSVKKALKELYSDGFIRKPSHGQYCSLGSASISSVNGSGFSDDSGPAPIRNFYEKDDD